MPPGLHLAMTLLGAALVACGAPQSRPATGPVAEEVRASLEAGQEKFAHQAWTRLLAEGTREGLVDYSFFQAHRAELDGYLERIAGAQLGTLAPAELEALLINAYNALTVWTILEHPAVGSIREIDGVWTEITHEVGGHRLTLDVIEHNLLRPFFRDPRIHFAVNCASLSCAPLPLWAFEGEGLDEQLEERTRAFLRSSENVRIEGDELLLSRYFDWYGEDFTAAGWRPRAESIAGFVARYSRPEIAAFVRERDAKPRIRFLEYDWSLNAAVPPRLEEPEEEEREGGRAPSSGTAVSGPDAGDGWVADLRGWVWGFGWAAPIVYGFAYMIAVVLFVPGAPLTIGAGVAFGLWAGAAIVAVAATTGASLAFLLARHLLRGRVERWIEGREKFEAVDRAVESQGWKIVVLTRLSPAFPFNLQNYAYGLTGVGLRAYVLASAVAMLPGTVLYVYLGVAGTEVAAAATGAAEWGRTSLQVVGLLATLAVVVFVTRVARRELARMTGGGDPDDRDLAETVDGSEASAPA